MKFGWPICLGATGLILCAWYVFAGCEKSTLPLFSTSGWPFRGELFSRMESTEGDSLLLMAMEDEEFLYVYRGLDPEKETGKTWHHVIYRYGIGDRTLRRVVEPHWERATGEICRPVGNSAHVRYVTIDLENYTLRRGSRSSDPKIETAGKWVLGLSSTTDERFATVLSANGRLRRGHFPMGGHLGASGQHYHQVFRLPEMIPVGEPVPIPLRSWRAPMRIYWSHGSRFVVYTDMYFQTLCVVHVKLGVDKNEIKNK